MAVDAATGLTIKTIEDILGELSAQQRADLEVTLNTSPEEPIGQMNGIIAAQLRELWELAQVAYNGFNPDAVEGFLQEKLSAITGTVRNPATKGAVSLDCDLNIGTTLLAGTNFANVTGEPDNRWTPVADFTAPGGGVQAVPFEAEFVGAVIANSGTITVISTPVVGWNSVTNPLDAVEGLEIETNAALRQRREEELRATGQATLDAIRADVLSDDEVFQCTVFENTSDVTDVNGVPPHGVEVVVFDGTPPTLTDDEIAQLIWDTKGGGIGTFGTDSGTATDSSGNSHTILFSRPAEIEIWVDVFPKIDSSSGYAGETALKAALVALNDSDFLLGRDVIANRLTEIVMSFAGVFDQTSPPELGFSVTPSGTSNLTIGPRDLARLDTGRIVVAETFATVP